MLNAKQANEIVKTKKEKENENKKARAEEFCNTIISLEIERVANLQGNKIMITDVEYDIIHLVNEILQENGYKTSVSGTTIINVKWGE